MSMFFRAALLVSQEITQEGAGQHTPAVGPVVYGRHQKAEGEDAYGPAAYLAVNSVAVKPPPAPAEIKGCPDEAADGGRSPYGERDAGKVGNKEAENTA